MLLVTCLYLSIHVYNVYYKCINTYNYIIIMLNRIAHIDTLCLLLLSECIHKHKALVIVMLQFQYIIV